ncbi:MAG: hypothetical protein QOE82_2113 [Thermoanaerobaculia bacterium]|jgi:K+-transporting ATPase KdpF subunit|nr:hypothetical protein [Thermoanaerobaculia bacterium]HXH40112.1 K(+)-transporting ATPase subunit F [Thermoanaerobaculia bacterium]
MTFETIVGLVLAVLGLIYLLYALLRAEEL